MSACAKDQTQDGRGGISPVFGDQPFEDEATTRRLRSKWNLPVRRIWPRGRVVRAAHRRRFVSLPCRAILPLAGDIASLASPRCLTAGYVLAFADDPRAFVRYRTKASPTLRSHGTPREFHSYARTRLLPLPRCVTMINSACPKFLPAKDKAGGYDGRAKTPLQRPYPPRGGL